jgi:hypothetical protein
MKIMSKSPSGHVVRLQGKLKLSKQKNIYIFLSFYYIFQHSDVPVISRFQWLR